MSYLLNYLIKVNILLMFLLKVVHLLQMVSAVLSPKKVLIFIGVAKKIVTESYGLYQSIFSRNKGILETDVMKKKCAVIIGCGSVGDFVCNGIGKSRR